MAKRVLLIAPVYFGYYKDMIQEFQAMQYEVDYVCDAPSNSNVSKALGRVNKNLIHFSTVRYFSKEVKPLIEKNTYNFVLLIGGMTFAFTTKMMEEIKKTQSHAKFIMYQWDSEKLLPYCTKMHPYFDVLYTFDRVDFENHTKYKFLPMFYNSVYEKIGQMPRPHYTYDCMYVGTAHPKKYHDINIMANKLKSVMPKQFIYHYMPSGLKYVYQTITDPLFKEAKWKEFKHEKLTSNEMMDVLSHSKCVLDSPQEGQTGLTVRSIECLGAKRKLITMNEDIKNYDFYNENNILIYKDDLDLNCDFFKTDYQDVPEDVYEKYSLHHWARTILQEDVL